MRFTASSRLELLSVPQGGGGKNTRPRIRLGFCAMLAGASQGIVLFFVCVPRPTAIYINWTSLEIFLLLVSSPTDVIHWPTREAGEYVHFPGHSRMQERGWCLVTGAIQNSPIPVYIILISLSGLPPRSDRGNWALLFLDDCPARETHVIITLSSATCDLGRKCVERQRCLQKG